MKSRTERIHIFLDGELSTFDHPELLSLAPIADDGRELYIERQDARELDVFEICIAVARAHEPDQPVFVRTKVIPLQGRYSYVILKFDNISGAIEVWSDELRDGNREITTVRLSGSPLDRSLVSELHSPIPGLV